MTPMPRHFRPVPRSTAAPTPLVPGSHVALIAPAGPVPKEGIQRAEERVQRMGFIPVLGANAHKRKGYLAGSDAERAQDLLWALQSEHIQAIWALRGGYGTLRLLDRIPWSELSAPKPFIGSSDHTTILGILDRLGWKPLHAPHAATPGIADASLDEIALFLRGESPTWKIQGQRVLVPGTARGYLAGGNLCMIAATLGTAYQRPMQGRILFLEEVGEAKYRIDRLLTQLLLSGHFEGVAGIIVGEIRGVPDAGNSQLPSVESILAERLGELGVPLITGFSFGHGPVSHTLPIGRFAEIDGESRCVQLIG